MDNSLILLFENTGFTNKEARVYLALLKLGTGDVTDIADITELKRSIIYVLLEGLMKRGYVSKLPDITVNTYQAIDPSMILNELQTSAKHFSEMLPVLRTLSAKGKKRPNIQFIDDPKAMVKIYNDANYHSEAYFISSFTRMNKCFPGATDNWINSYEKGVFQFKSKSLIPNNDKDKEIGEGLIAVGQEVRCWTALNDIQMDLALYEDKLTITSLGENPYLVLFKSKELADSIKPLFELAWSNGNKIKDGEKIKKNKNTDFEIKLA